MNNLHILNLAKYEAPAISENKRNEWVTYGENNEYFNQINDYMKIQYNTTDIRIIMQTAS